MSVARSERRQRGELSPVLVIDDESDIRELIELTLVRAEIMQGEPELTEHTALRWLHGEEFQLEELCPADRELLLKCQKKLFSYKN